MCSLLGDLGGLAGYLDRLGGVNGDDDGGSFGVVAVWMFRLKRKSNGVLECCSDHIRFSSMTPSGGLACAWLHITNDRAIWRKSNIEVSGVDSAECLEVNVIVGVRNMLLVSTLVLREFIDFGLKLPTSVLTLGGNIDGDMLPYVLVDFGSLFELV
ncbi:hypothetical protein M0R45_009887 [Rubus argutus]|uniref:Uncharacterized protein n=1 Tax=Rubus argutus TaxID=59490 RepID=A0AAW1Y5S7_RUBAR